MTQFNVLPTDERFLSLTEDQLAFIISSMEIDIEQQQPDRRNDWEDDEFDMDTPLPKFSEEDMAIIAPQLEELMTPAIKENIEEAKRQAQKLKDEGKSVEFGGTQGNMPQGGMDREEADKIVEKRIEKAHEIAGTTSTKKPHFKTMEGALSREEADKIVAERLRMATELAQNLKDGTPLSEETANNYIIKDDKKATTGKKLNFVEDDDNVVGTL